MSLVLTSYPVSHVGPIFTNMFPGFLPCLVSFKREDQAVTNITSGTDTKIKITIGVDIRSSVSVGDSIYIYSPGTNIIYSGNARILEIDATTVTIDIDFIENASGGYINYLKNYNLECKLVHSDFETADLLGYSIKSDGDLTGIINIDVSVIVDKTRGQYESDTKEVSDGRIKFMVKFKENYTGSADTWHLIESALTAGYIGSGIDPDDLIEMIILYATADFDMDQFIYEQDTPKIWAGYPAVTGVIHSDTNDYNERLNITYDELDLNKTVIIADQPLATFEEDNYGMLIAKIELNLINVLTNYITLKGEYIPIGDFLYPDFATPSFKTT